MLQSALSKGPGWRPTWSLGLEGVPNPIAYDAARDRFFVTDELRPKLFEIAQKRKR